MDALMEAIESNQVKTRILVSSVLVVGIENSIAIDAFQKELAARGLSDLVEIRFFDGDMHVKTALIDDELLILGNQNYHYSAWDDGALVEYNLATENPEAIEDYKQFFNHHWNNAKPVEQAE